MKTLTQTELIERIVEMTEDKYDLSKPQVKDVLQSLEAVVYDAVDACERVKIGNLVTIGVRIKKATKKRMGRNPQTGEEVPISAKPAATAPAIRVSKLLKDAILDIPVAKARRHV